MPTPAAEIDFYIDMFRGDSLTIVCEVADLNDVPIVLTGGSAKFTAKSDYNNVTPTIFKSTVNPLQAAIVDGINGKLEIYIVPSDTVAITEDTTLVYDIEVTLASLEVYTVACGNLRIKLDVSGGT